MALVSDSRIPVVFGRLEEALPTDAVLFEAPAQRWGGTSASFTPAQEHPPGCTCCAVRVAAGRALSALLHDRARGKIPFFSRVLAVTRTETGQADLLVALAQDPVASACFRRA